MSQPDYVTILSDRIADRRNGLLQARTRLRHFSLITYVVPPERLARHIPDDRFEIAAFEIDGAPRALVSAVPFLDVDFHFAHLAPAVKQAFGQTNYRAYVIDRATGQHGVWFFGTTLGSPVVHLPVLLWRIPWHTAAYQMDCRYDTDAGRYTRYRMRMRSGWGGAHIELDDTGEPLGLLPGFASVDAQRLILTHPVDGYFYRGDGKLGTYSVWHDVVPLTAGRARLLHFQVFEDLGILSRDEMQKPHSVGICPETEFHINLPPRAVLPP